MLVHLVDPPAYTPPYDHALAAALARTGVQVELISGEFGYGEEAEADGYRRRRLFYRRSPGRPGGRLRRAARLAQHVPDMLAYRRTAAEADIVHFGWLTLPQLDRHLLPRGRPLVLTAHDVLPREPRPGQVEAQRRVLAAMDAVVVHSEHGARRLRDEVGLDPARVHVVPHGAFRHLTAAPADAALPPELLTGIGAPAGRPGPVVLHFGLLRPYKGVDVLLDAWARMDRPAGAELWIVGMPRMDISALRGAAPADVRWVPRFVSDAELAAVFRAADAVVLPYREIDQSGVLFTALAFGVPTVLTAVGGFGEIAAQGLARVVPPDDARALASTLAELLADGPARAAMAHAQLRAAAPDGPLGWDAIARAHVRLYESLLAERA